MATCRDCGAPIRFITLRPGGRVMPINPIPDRNGNVWAWAEHTRWIGMVATLDHHRDALILEQAQANPAVTRTPFRYRPHAADCPTTRDRPTPDDDLDPPEPPMEGLF